MQLLLGTAKTTDKRKENCFICRSSFDFQTGDLIIVVEFDKVIQKSVGSRHVCPSCGKLENAQLINRIHEAARRYRGDAEDLRQKADTKDNIAAAFEAIGPEDINRSWLPNVFS